MKKINEFLGKFLRFGLEAAAQKTAVKEIIERRIGVGLKEENLSLKNGVVWIHGSFAFKQIVVLNKEQILSDTRSLNFKQKITDIRT